jgi:polysaccharide transporter, PST family
MTLIKTSLLTALSTIARILSGFVITKVIALYAGPSGLAIVGQLQNFNSLVMTFAKGGVTQGIVKYTAEYKTIEKKQKIFSTSIIISIVSSLLVGVVLIFFSEYFSNLILKNIAYENVFVVFGFTIILFSLNSVLLSVLNGQKELIKLVLANITASIFSLFFTSFLIVQNEIVGALYALVLNQSVVFFITLLFLIKTPWFKMKYFIQGVDKKSLSKLAKFSLMAITSALTVPVSHLIIRNYIGENLSWDDAGYWQAMWYISSMYLMVITTSLGVYYLPKLSEIKDKKELTLEIISGYKVIMPVVICLAVLIFAFKEYVILIAFSDEFIGMSDLFKWQLIGDVVKIASWLIGYVTLAKAMVKIYISLEILGSLSFVLLSMYCVDTYGLVGITYAYTINYIMYLFIMIFIYMRYVNQK